MLLVYSVTDSPSLESEVKVDLYNLKTKLIKYSIVLLLQLNHSVLRMKTLIFNFEKYKVLSMNDSRVLYVYVCYVKN